ncbi:hypothetical protein [Streptomyces stelliscabiei]|uniref:Uncharacterized protein n=1 Tax=Streptomyces stelliscabiei TaxID=146820 RepID=A0A8I0PIV7_9ACTN|nr:hypothetical protein [Streptomyces stelliscabiei]KND39805.1 hypothetical protein IQ64_36775 [Streptomyces stelliscabiei]MBE1603060.1 hypothetical protein [Streptomyces stelliscabiei]MDX2557619.1 hypothetical protein [Streptomyces stelliscabiei]MDX2617128.1 hypothetical protein [Streptomyces stelliscabiei]MDX2641502.1 hypothetical protein [Streptomyces stelliscabiei]
MQSDDKPVNGQPSPNSPSFFDLFDQTPEPPVTGRDKAPGAKRFARLREAWDASWEQGGFLYERWEEVFQARQVGWHKMANWIKAVLILAGVCAFIVLLDTAGDIVSAVADRLVTATPTTQAAAETSNGFWAVIDNPIRSYIARHTGPGLAVSGSAVYAFWQLTGLFGLIGGFAGSTGARITWTLWGTASVGAVWSASPDDGRTIATGIAVLLWTMASTVALRGLGLRPVIHTGFQPQIDIRPEIHIPPQPVPVHDGLDDEPDNVHRLQH